MPEIVSRNKESVLEVVKNIEKNVFEVFYAFAELTKPKQCKAAVESALKYTI